MEGICKLKVDTWKEVFFSILVAILFTGGSYLTAMKMEWITAIDPLEAFAVFTSYSCTYLCVRQSRFNYIIGTVSVTALGYLFWKQGLVASAALQAYLIPTLVYGWFRWKSDNSTRRVTSVFESPPYAIALYFMIPVVAYVLVLFTLIYFGTTLPAADTAILCLSVLAQFLLDNKKKETWYVWMAVNFLAIWTYYEAGLFLVAFQGVIFQMNTFYGLYEWKKTEKKAGIVWSSPNEFI